MKKDIILLFCLLFLIFVPCMAQDPEAEPEVYTYNNWSYIQNDTGWTLTEYNGDEPVIIIPSYIAYKPVTEIKRKIMMPSENDDSEDISSEEKSYIISEDFIVYKPSLIQIHYIAKVEIP